MSLIDIKAIKAAAQKEINAERAEKVKKALMAAYRRREAAQQVVRNIDAEIADLEASIEEGSFVG
jgi:hypothetical protein